jgi:hypothetical protein
MEKDMSELGVFLGGTPKFEDYTAATRTWAGKGHIAKKFPLGTFNAWMDPFVFAFIYSDAGVGKGIWEKQWLCGPWQQAPANGTSGSAQVSSAASTALTLARLLESEPWPAESTLTRSGPTMKAANQATLSLFRNAEAQQGAITNLASAMQSGRGVPEAVKAAVQNGAMVTATATLEKYESSTGVMIVKLAWSALSGAERTWDWRLRLTPSAGGKYTATVEIDDTNAEVRKSIREAQGTLQFYDAIRAMGRQDAATGVLSRVQ